MPHKKSDGYDFTLWMRLVKVTVKISRVYFEIFSLDVIVYLIFL